MAELFFSLGGASIKATSYGDSRRGDEWRDGASVKEHLRLYLCSYVCVCVEVCEGLMCKFN